MKRPSLLVGIFLISLALRIIAITVPINSDEVLWMERGGIFIRRLLEGDLTDTFIRHHPGVINMWLTGSSMLFHCWMQKLFPGWLDLNLSSDLTACLNTGQFPIILYILPRLLHAVLTSMCMVCFYMLTKQLLGRSVALCAISLLLFEPFFLAYQRYLTTDALQADFGVLALLLFLLYLRGNGDSERNKGKHRSRRLLFASGVFMGLATVTKVIALLLLLAILICIVLIELGVWRTSFPQRGWKRQFTDLLRWTGTTLVAFTLFFPAMWVSPGFVVTQIYKGLLQESDRGLLFFLGQLTDSPSPLFYPLVLAYRLSPVLQIGLLVAIAILLVPKLRHGREKIPELAALAFTSLFVLFILSMSDSKIDRYLNMILPILASLSAVGWLEIVGWGKGLWQRLRQRRISSKWLAKGSVSTALALALLQLIFLLPYSPYYLSYYNPLLGGPRVAKNIFMVGQGEGLDQAAQWLNQSPNAKNMTVASWSGRAFGAYFRGQTLSIPKYVEPTPPPWTKANRVVLYYNQFQRGLPEPKMVAYFAAQPPLHTVQLHDIDYAQIYPGPVPLPEDIKSIQFPLELSFGEQVRLLGYDLNTSNLLSRGELLVTFYWSFVAPLPPNFMLNVDLRDRHSGKIQHLDSPLLAGYLSSDKIAPGTVLRDVHQIKVAPAKQSGNYQLAVGWFSPVDGKVLQVQDKAGNSQGTQAVFGKIDL